ncbi:type II toxin-antitoxin system RelE/ParE family toxin [Asticcacaulis sp. YBE204]|uniref:type II toxin-antitoxin system RelE/ParE family toxin n=1 Tax=Asticcacaulis sp. YBE204 TaxID=1282363 RepID=UPI0003C41251|nr:type II toxin-antitoxin system RelE/ParE family toxin [Asticcacaulis sp. YBE204]ESQ81293.1 hypothetical protein AEYBE204_02840 [Asticcacaulis sp. YBE204]
MKVEYTKPARNDLREIANYIAQDNPRRALSFTVELRNKAETIGDAPYGFPIMERYQYEGIRRKPFRDYLIFYRINADAIWILRVLHSARDIDELL